MMGGSSVFFVRDGGTLSRPLFISCGVVPLETGCGLSSRSGMKWIGRDGDG